MKEALDLRSKSGIHRLITALEERGFIRRLPHRARALEVVKLPESVAPSLSAQRNKAAFSPNVIQGSLGRVKALPQAADGSPRGAVIPVMGRIAAGVPKSAIEDHTHNIAVPPEMLGTGDHFALEVKGDSMVDAGIFEGDTVVIRKADTAQTGDIVVALDRRGGSHPQAVAPQRRLDRTRSGEQRIRNAHIRARPRTGAGKTRRADPAVLSVSPHPGLST